MPYGTCRDLTPAAGALAALESPPCGRAEPGARSCEEMHRMIDRDWAERFASEWIDGWNSHDLERIFSHYTDDFEMSSPFIVEMMKVPSGVLRGKVAIRPYWTAALERKPPIKFELLGV